MDKKGKIFFYALVTFVGLYFFLNTFGAYTLLRQEDVQIFLPVWSVLSEKMLSPGGCCEIIGKFLVQYYTSPLWTCILLSASNKSLRNRRIQGGCGRFSRLYCQYNFTFL